MPEIPQERALDSTIAFLREGYSFVSRRCERHGSDIFAARLMLRRAYCVRGSDAARMFFTPGRFTRKAAVPPTTLLLLQDGGSVQWLDGAAHAHRKALFLRVLSEAAVESLRAEFERQWRSRSAAWPGRKPFSLHHEMEDLLCRTACRWAGLDLHEAPMQRRLREFTAMIDGAGAVGPRNWRGLMLRARSERWAREVIGNLRAIPGRDGATPAASIAHHRDAGGALLDVKVAAVELINLLRPMVAVARFITFAALALHAHPASRARLASGDEAYARAFAEEVRRFYPFFPLLGGRALEPFEWRGHRFEAGTWFLYDIHGTHHDPRAWDAPAEFRPERFLPAGSYPEGFAPQGGGAAPSGHRCPGEPATVSLVASAARLLASLDYEVPPQDLRVSMRRMPAIPASGLRIAVSEQRNR